MKKILIAAALVLTVVIVLVVLLTRDKDEALIKKELSVLCAVCSKSKDSSSELLLMGKTNKLKTMFTEDCSISVGRPVPEISGVGTLAAVFYQAMRAVSEISFSFRDISVTIDDTRTSAVTTMTAKATGSDAGGSGGLEAREIRMLWKKVDGTWKISEATVVEILR